jgi:stage II sporulation protein D
MRQESHPESHPAEPRLSETANVIAAGWVVVIAMLMLAIVVVLPKRDAGSTGDDSLSHKRAREESAAIRRLRARQASESPSEPPATVPPGIYARLSKRGDDKEMISVLDGDTIVEMSLEHYVIGSTAAEMPASFRMEALKAQAVAVRTNVLYGMLQPKARHPDAQVCTNYACCMAYAGDEALRRRWGGFYAGNLSRIISAVIGTDGLYLTYDGEPIFAAFHSSSAGRTETCGNVWLNNLPYLVSVASPETARQVPNFVATVTVTEADFREKIRREYPSAALRGGADTWVGVATHNRSGRVAQVEVGGVNIRGTAMRTMFGLRSTAFTLEDSGGSFVFTTTGYGHGVGMSQYGAGVMAARGRTFDEILLAYYTGVAIESRIEKALAE